MSKTLKKRLDKIENSFTEPDDKVADIGFIIPDQPVQMFGIEFESLEQCIKYCDANDIPYAKEKGCFGFDAYEFPTA